MGTWYQVPVPGYRARTTRDVTKAQRDFQQQAQDDAHNRVGFSSVAPVKRLPSPRSLQKAMLLIVEGRMSRKPLA
jgi:hypothetical protein